MTTALRESQIIIAKYLILNEADEVGVSVNDS